MKAVCIRVGEYRLTRDEILVDGVNLGKTIHDDIASGHVTYVGRRCTMGGWNLPHTKWGNPFKVDADNDIDSVLARYEKHVRNTLWNDLDELYDKTLGCFCKVHKGERCHAQVLVMLCNEKRTTCDTVQSILSLDVHFDGSALLDSAARYAFVLCIDDKSIYEKSGKITEGRMTSPRAELTALLQALKSVMRRIDSMNVKEIHVFGDNQYAIKSCNEWLDDWKKRNWCKADGKLVSNRDLLEQIDARIRRIQRRNVTIDFTHIKGHSKPSHSEHRAAKWNRYVDKLAGYSSHDIS